MNFIRLFTKLLSLPLSRQAGRSFLIIVMATSSIIALSLPGKAQQMDGKNNLVQTTLQLPWHHQFQFAGYYAAIEQNYYKEAGFKVTIKSGSPKLKPVDEVLSGIADYGVAPSQLLLHRLHGKPLVALAAVFQHSALVFLAKKESGISAPQEMIGRRVMLLPGDGAAEYLAVFHNEGVALDQVDIIPSSFEINDLLDGKTDVFNAYITNEPYYLKQLNIPTTVIKPTTYGIDFYGDTLFTSEQKLNTNPDQVKRFRSASLRGWKYAMEHPTVVIDLLKDKYEVVKSVDHLQFEADAMRQLILPDLIEIGHMNPGRWRHMAETYVQLEMADPGYNLDDFIYNPNPEPDFARFYRLLWITIILFILTGIVMLIYFNRRLQRLVQERTNELANQEVRFRETFNKINSGIAIYKAIEDGNDFIFQDLNPTGLKSIKLQKQEIIDKSILDIFPSVVEMGLFEVFQRVWRTGVPEYHPPTLYKDQRVELWVKNYICKLPSGELVAVYDDITKRRQDEEKLLLSRILIDQSNDAIFVIDLQTSRFLDVNQRVCDSLQYSRDELFHMEVKDIEMEISEDFWQEHVTQLKVHGNQLREGTHRRKDGTTFPVEVSLNYIQLSDREYMVAVARDIHERKAAEKALQESEQKYRRFFTSVNNGWAYHRIVTDKKNRPVDYIFLEVNESYEKLTGLKKEDIIGKRVTEVLPGIEQDPACWIERFGDVALTGKSVSFENYAEPLKRWYSVSVSCPEKGYFIVVFDEITERKQAEKDLLRTMKDLQDVNAELSQFNYVVAHDLKAPIRAMSNYATFLQEDLTAGVSGETKKYLTRLRQTAIETGRLVEDLLLLAKIGSPKEEAVEIELGDFMEKLIRSMTLSPDIDIHLGSVWPTILSDPLLLRQVFQNLIDNASKYNIASRKRIEIGSLPGKDDGITIFVRDNGIGIDAAYHEQIFGLFERLHPPGEYRGGTGVGLAIVKKSVNLLGGTIRLESTEGKGTTFYVSLPVETTAG